MDMHACWIHTFGGPEILRDDVLPVPTPQGDQILVRIMAASVNPVDAKIREGKFPKVGDDDLPVTLGRDLSGVIEECGPSAQFAAKGDAVFALLGYDRGAYAQYVLVEKDEWTHKPADLSHAEAAAVPLAALTAWQGMIDQGDLKSGQRVLIHGGAGGVGHLAIQIAKAKGAWVATTCSGEDLDFVRSIGADEALDYKAEKFEDRLSDIDLVYDLVAGETQERSFKVLKQGGALISTLQEPDKAKALYKNIKIAHYMAKPDANELAQIAELLAKGKIKPVVHAKFDLSDAAGAQTALAKDHVRGKVVIIVNGQDW
jgi:NADPH:quinone reductase-like Zn-dependent oxidoreductase